MQPRDREPCPRAEHRREADTYPGGPGYGLKEVAASVEARASSTRPTENPEAASVDARAGGP